MSNDKTSPPRDPADPNESRDTANLKQSALALRTSEDTELLLVLVLADGEVIRHELLLDDQLFIGRSRSATIPIEDDTVSRHHAEIRVGPAGPILRDLGSHNGTFINEERIFDQFIGIIAGDTLRFGSVRGQVHKLDPARRRDHS